MAFFVAIVMDETAHVREREEKMVASLSSVSLSAFILAWTANYGGSRRDAPSEAERTLEVAVAMRSVTTKVR